MPVALLDESLDRVGCEPDALVVELLEAQQRGTDRLVLESVDIEVAAPLHEGDPVPPEP